MTDFEIFYKNLLEQIKLHEEKGILIKTERDSDFDIVKIYGENISALAKAKNSINDITELAYTTAEHHPYWNLLYNSAEIIQTLLDKWEGTLDEKDQGDIRWAIRELTQTIEKVGDVGQNR